MTPSNETFELVLTGGDGPRRFTAFVPNGDGGHAAEHTFEWRTDSTALAMELGELARAATSGHEPENDLHVTFGKRLFETVFAGAVGDLWHERRNALPRRRSLRLVLRVDPESARPLLNLPWEYLHDGKDFLATNRRTPLSRLPWGVPAESLPPLEEPLRVLVCIAAPFDLDQNQVLNTGREEGLILGALQDARRTGGIQTDFTTNGSPEALADALREFDPHILHFTGHGVFVEADDTGVLLMETPDGRERKLPNAGFAGIIDQEAESLRLVFLSACQSARASRNDGYADLGPRLLEVGIPAVVAMQFSVFNRSAMDFGSDFYRSLAGGKPVDVALTEARRTLKREGINTVDFATPVLYLSDPGCLRVDEAALRESEAPATPLDLTGVVPAPNFVGRNAELRALQTGLDPDDGRWRAAVIHGLGGMGKTVLAARLAGRMAARFAGIKAIRMTPTTTARDVLDQIGAFLSVNNARLNHPRIPEFVQVKDAPLPLETKAALLLEILRERPLLLIFDNYEDVLPGGREVSRAVTDDDGEEQAGGGLDPELPKLVALLVGGECRDSRFVFTSRVDFDPVEPGRLGDAVRHLPLGEMRFRDAVYLMETLSPLDELPVAVVPSLPQPSRPGQEGGLPLTPTLSPRGEGETEPAPATGEEGETAAGEGVRALSLRDLYGRLGGHPYTLVLFAEHARRSSPDAVLGDLAGVRRELLEFTLLERAAGALPERARSLLHRAAVYEEPVPVEGLAFLMGDEEDVMPPVEAEVGALLDWGLLARLPGDGAYEVHTPVRDWAWKGTSPEKRLALQRRAARFWMGMGADSHDLDHVLFARRYFFQTGDYEQADDIVAAATEPLLRWGQIELLIYLLNESVRTLSGNRRAVALGNLAMVYQGLGHYTAAREIYEQVLAEFEDLDDRRNVATALHQLGNLHYLQGEYPGARQRYEQSLTIKQELGDRAGVAKSLHQLGMLHYLQGEYPRARQRYEQALSTFQELGDRANVAQSLHGLGILHQAQGEYPQARQRYEQSLTIAQELGDRAGVALSLGQLGRLYEDEGEPAQAVAHLAPAFAMLKQLGSPQRDIAGSALARLREKMGEEAFQAALKDASDPEKAQAIASAVSAGGETAGESVTIEQLAGMAVQNTVAVLTEAPDKKEEWWNALGELHKQARTHGDEDFAAFLDALRRLVEGTRPESLGDRVPAPFREAWEAVVRGAGAIHE